ncbi:hypothetical protein TRICI_002838 [Trichomonascus ciferrii]|uniref:C2H2-type domain-containing protein n=1 Tax=Trichomonascus ciferrii TaxID=44093 RepID=A0A642V4T7_9ASCO|nr:hypothetical protein TRICI_002838 [Trichomonascus ciferrii]
MATSGSFLLPNPPMDGSNNNVFRHRRSNSNHSDVSSIAGGQSPHLSASPSPYHSAFSSPYLPPQVPGNDGLMRSGELTNLEQLTSNFSLLDDTTSREQQQQQQQQPFTTSATSPTPEISVDYAPANIHPPHPSLDTSALKVESESPSDNDRSSDDVHTDNSLSFGNSPVDIKQEDDHNESTTTYLPTPAAGGSRNRQRSQSDSDLRQPPYPYQPQPPPPQQQQQQQYASSDFLSPESAAMQQPATASSSSRRSRSVSSSSRTRSRSRSRSTSRDYILELAAPTQTNKRVQKHPSAFACTLCDKRFTRAYNLRSHLRTHTDERPFVCTVCGKAFARQHDRKRHEALHSGEKKFECRGVLSDGSTVWGCGRKFARADALGRHFRTEAGRECIRPLLEEEEKEKGKRRPPQGQQQYGNQMAGGGYQNMGAGEVPIYVSGGEGTPSLMLSPPNGDPGANSSGNSPSSAASVFPTALLQQFPSLGNIELSGSSDASDLEN